MNKAWSWRIHWERQPCKRLSETFGVRRYLCGGHGDRISTADFAHGELSVPVTTLALTTCRDALFGGAVAALDGSGRGVGLARASDNDAAAARGGAFFNLAAPLSAKSELLRARDVMAQPF